MTIVNDESCTSVAVKESNDETKFKAKTTNCQYTFIVKDKAQAQKMKDALGTSNEFIFASLTFRTLCTLSLTLKPPLSIINKTELVILQFLAFLNVFLCN
jgi:hypothetical protein